MEVTAVLHYRRCTARQVVIKANKGKCEVRDPNHEADVNLRLGTHNGPRVSHDVRYFKDVKMMLKNHHCFTQSSAPE
jgi:hypothetical protein